MSVNVILNLELKVMIMSALDYKSVKIDVDKLLKNHQSVLFREFIEANRDKIFTAIHYGTYSQMYILLEDTSTPQWLFFEDDLIEVE